MAYDPLVEEPGERGEERRVCLQTIDEVVAHLRRYGIDLYDEPLVVFRSQEGCISYIATRHGVEIGFGEAGEPYVKLWYEKLCECMPEG